MHRRHRISVASGLGVLVLLSGSFVPVGAQPVVPHQTATATWNLSYPMTLDYRTIGADPNIRCNADDATFENEIVQEGLDQYTALMVDGQRGTCPRLKAEQFKRLYPGKPVILYQNANGADPRTWPGGAWPGYYLMMNRSQALAPVVAGQTQITVADPGHFSAGDMAVMWSPSQSDPYANGEYVRVQAINGSTLTVKRNYFALGSVTYPVAPLMAALPTGPSSPGPEYNLSDIAPVNPSTGQQAIQWLSTTMLADFAGSDQANTTLDAMEFDAASWVPIATNTNGSVKNLDCNGDGVVDYCNRGIGSASQVNSYGVGYDEFVQLVKAGLAQFDTDSARPAKMLLADGELGMRSIATVDGAEFEHFPSWSNYTMSSSALSELDMWTKQDTASGPHFSYAFTKQVTPAHNAVSQNSPLGCVTPTMGGTCSNSEYRYGMASALVTGSASAYNNEAGFSAPLPWDEEATVNQATTGLAPGYLGAPTGPPQRTTSYTSGELNPNITFDQGLTPVTSGVVTPAAMSVAVDTTTAAPGFGTSSLRADVTSVTASPAIGDAKILQTLNAPVLPNKEYTVDFWAKSANETGGPQVLQLGVSLNAVGGAPQIVEVAGQWTHYTVGFMTTQAPPRASTVKFFTGQALGSYWLDGISVHQGTAGIITRQYTNGIVVLNDSFSSQTNVVLPGGPYHHINGVQDRLVNDGSSVGTTLPRISAKDGEILLTDYTTPGLPLATTRPATAVVGGTAVLNGTVDPTGTDTTVSFEWGPTTSYGSTTPNQDAGSGTSNAAMSAPLTGLTPGIVYHFRVDAINSVGSVTGTDLLFSAPPLPTATTTTWSTVGPTVAALSGFVNPMGQATTYSFEWGSDTTYGNATISQSAGSGITPLKVTGSLTGLTPGATYHFRLEATNASGTADGADSSFVTTPPPVVFTGFGTSTGAHSADLAATVNPKGIVTTWQFQWGLDTSYGQVTTSHNAGAGTVPVHVTAGIYSLVTGTTYHFRLVGVSAAGETDGNDMTYTAH